MANGNTANEIKELLEDDGAIKTTTALRLMLDLQVQQFEQTAKLVEHIKKTDEETVKYRQTETGRINDLMKWKETIESDKREARKMWLSPLINMVVTVGVTTVINAIIFYSTYKVLFDQLESR